MKVATCRLLNDLIPDDLSAMGLRALSASRPAIQSMVFAVVVSAGLVGCDGQKGAQVTDDKSESAKSAKSIEPARTKSHQSESRESLAEMEAAEDKDLQVAKSLEGMDEAARRVHLERLIYQHATGDRELACAAYRILAAEHAIPVAVTSFVAAALADNDPEEALYWIEELPPGANRRAAYAQLCSTLAQQSPEHAADLATKTVPFESESAKLYIDISGAWAKSAPAAAAEWTGRFPQGATRNAALAAVIQSWDQAEAGKWIQGISDSALRKDALAILDSTLAGNASPPSPPGKLRLPLVE